MHLKNKNLRYVALDWGLAAGGTDTSVKGWKDVDSCYDEEKLRSPDNLKENSVHSGYCTQPESLRDVSET